ncbi:MAG: DUF72 domain-containing protein [Flavisolibacter sp.]|nr:DUF72 domain-containing protein [Flavisolibacter sp.]
MNLIKVVWHISLQNVRIAGNINIRTSGWSYKHWKEKFYPLKFKATDWLEYYATFFSCTKINTSFYHYQNRRRWKTGPSGLSGNLFFVLN